MSIARSSLFFSVGTLISRISGLVRDVVTTHILGAGPLHDAFVVAQRIPNLLRDMLAEGALASSFTKVYTALKEQDADGADRLLFQMLYLCFLFMLSLTTLGMAFAPQLVDFMSLGDSGSVIYAQNAISLTKILFPSLGMSVLGAVAMGALYQKGRFFFNAVIPVLANLGVIFGGLVLGDWLLQYAPAWVDRSGDARVLGLAWGTILGFLIQMLAALWSVRTPLLHLGSELWKTVPWTADVKQVLVLMAPAVVATSAAPINSIVNTNFATGVGPGAVTWLTYAFRILQLPIGIFGVAVGVYALPALTRAVVKAGKRVDEGVSQELQQACTFVSWLLLPCMLFTLINYQRIIDFLFRHGHYSETDALATGSALYAYSFSMLAYGLIKVLTAFYYATDRTSFAMKVSLFSICSNVVGNLLFVHRFGHVGLALTSSMTLCLNAGILLWGSKRMGAMWDFTELGRQLLWLGIGGSLYLSFSALNPILGVWIEQTLGAAQEHLSVLGTVAQERWAQSLRVILPKAGDFIFLSLQGLLLLLCFGSAGLRQKAGSWQKFFSLLRRGLRFRRI